MIVSENRENRETYREDSIRVVAVCAAAAAAVAAAE